MQSLPPELFQEIRQIRGGRRNFNMANVPYSIELFSDGSYNAQTPHKIYEAIERELRNPNNKIRISVNVVSVTPNREPLSLFKQFKFEINEHNYPSLRFLYGNRSSPLNGRVNLILSPLWWKLMVDLYFNQGVLRPVTVQGNTDTAIEEMQMDVLRRSGFNKMKIDYIVTLQSLGVYRKQIPVARSISLQRRKKMSKRRSRSLRGSSWTRKRKRL